METVIQCSAAGRTFSSPGLDPVIAVDAVDLSIAPGEFVAIQGPSGSGKTTLLGLMAGLELPDTGQVTVLGHDLAHLETAERARLRRSRLGIVLQSYGLIASLDAGQNVALPLLLDGVPPLERAMRADEALHRVGLADAWNARVDELSGGERQRVAVARALVTRPSVILADEPAGSLDSDTARVVLELLEAANTTDGTAIVLVTHDPVSAARAHRHLRISDGRLFEGPQ